MLSLQRERERERERERVSEFLRWSERKREKRNVPSCFVWLVATERERSEAGRVDVKVSEG